MNAFLLNNTSTFQSFLFKLAKMCWNVEMLKVAKDKTLKEKDKLLKMGVFMSCVVRMVVL